MANVEIPKSASVEKYWTGTYGNDTLEVTLYKGYASDGYKSDFERRQARWIEWVRYTPKGVRVRRRASRYGGQRYAKGLTDYANAIQQLLDADAKDKG